MQIPKSKCKINNNHRHVTRVNNCQQVFIFNGRCSCQMLLVRKYQLCTRIYDNGSVLPRLTSRGALNFFSGRGVRPGFPKCGACELTFASEKGGLWAENFQIWGLVSWKFQNLGACELKFGWELRLLRLKFPNFLKRGSCELTLLLEMGPLRAAGEAWKGGLQGRTSPYPLSRSVPPPPGLTYLVKFRHSNRFYAFVF